ncbi:protein-glutamate methylesterase/protein-glutamine glutaminase [Thiomicrorhabdus heinhorstiae]|uniref:Protein-glutamate methylesterase/protein-glutamine glutaminase n=1 Tax=Thiomicrorhabdus heinhorstiae TaxID=2748010 RepID=A0ABS0BX19_9GAMM|nr:chemotaxis response regulator protein-glutamate methylesterase [Thiomicrorhabdus heinhorstiae]MBF6058350.1 chemotaxis response regulator protein-glutamate methylesterase [Thiomicrorhabdus heinhorstiae]
MATAIKVLIVDDSALVRTMLSEMLSSDPQIEVIGTATDPYDAREKIKRLHPDVVTLDVEMPKMDGVTFLKNLMRLHPLPVVMVSTLTEKGADVTFDALDVGAIDFVTKPKIDFKHTFEDYTLEICSKIKMASKVSRTRLELQYQRFLNQQSRQTSAEKKKATGEVPVKLSTDSVLPKKAFNPKMQRGQQKIIAIGASTGGTEAIKEILMQLPAETPPVVITQHIPASFSKPFAQRMNGICDMQVWEASDGQLIEAGNVYIAPGDRHLILERVGMNWVCRLNDGPAVNRHKPSVDVMFRSVVQSFGPKAVGVLLTGMGADGAQGLKELQDVGAPTIAQDEKSSVVWGMPGEAVKLGAADSVLPLEKIADKVLRELQK